MNRQMIVRFSDGETLNMGVKSWPEAAEIMDHVQYELDLDATFEFGETVDLIQSLTEEEARCLIPA